MKKTEVILKVSKNTKLLCNF